MKNCVSLETAKALKEAGFVAQAPEMLQAYYIQGAFFYITKIISDSVFIAHKDGSEPTPFSLEWLKACTFAPSATDILAQMDTHIQLSKGRDGWICKKGEFFEVDICPHEAAAKMFIDRKKYGHDKIQK